MRANYFLGGEVAINHDRSMRVGLVRAAVLLALLAPISKWPLNAAPVAQAQKPALDNASEVPSAPDLSLTPPSSHDLWLIDVIPLSRSQASLLMRMGDVAFEEEDFTSGLLSGMQLYRLAALLSDDPSKAQHMLTIRLAQAIANVQRDYASGRASNARDGAELLSYIDPADERIKALVSLTATGTHELKDRPVGGNVASGGSGTQAPSYPSGNAFEEDQTRRDAVKKAWNDAQMATLGYVKEEPVAVLAPPPPLPLPTPIKRHKHRATHSGADAENDGLAATPAARPEPGSAMADSGSIPSEPPSALSQSTEALSKEIKANAVYNTPPSMNIKETREIELFASVGKKPAELASKVTAPGTIHEDDFLTADRVQAELTGQGFQVDPETPKEQLVGANNIVHWMWRVTPKETGHQQLRLVVSNIIKDAGSDVPNTVATFERYIDVNVTPWQQFSDFEQSNWQWEASTLFIPLAVWGWNRRKQAAVAKQGGDAA